MPRNTSRLVLLLLLAIQTPGLYAADKDNAPKDDAAKDPDLQAQGEYEGELATLSGQKAYGVQVVAKGDGKFAAVGYGGGLPGSGWDKGETRQFEGETKDGVTKFDGGEITGTLKDGVATISTTGGITLGMLKKVHRESASLGAKPPEGAVVLFDGKNADAFPGAKLSEDGLLIQGATSKQKFQSGTLHIEFRLPFMPKAGGQGRGNSGCYLQGRYEVQILDSFGLKGENNECGGIYSIKAPDVNMCFPPMNWQTYDIEFTAATYEGDKKVKPARMTVRHNGVVIHNDVEVPKSTTAAPVAEGPEPGPIYLQDHGNPVRFRNIWFVAAK